MSPDIKKDAKKLMNIKASNHRVTLNVRFSETHLFFKAVRLDSFSTAGELNVVSLFFKKFTDIV